MIKTLPFEEHVAEYEEWFEKYNHVFLSEIFAIRELLPKGENLYGLEVGAGTGRFSQALGIKEGVDPSVAMREIASKRGINIMDGEVENLPYHDLSFDFVLMVFCISYFEDLHKAFKETFRVLKHNSCLILGFIDKNSLIGRYYESKRQKSVFYKHAIFYSVQKITNELKEVGFHQLQFSQTLFHNLDEIKDIEIAEPGYGKGSFVLIKAIKK